MRLSAKEINIIKDKAQLIFGEVIIYVFGSRIDDTKKGGDIDLYLVSENKDDLFKKKLRLKALLENALYKPVDIIIAKDKNRLIEQEALKWGIKL